MPQFILRFYFFLYLLSTRVFGHLDPECSFTPFSFFYSLPHGKLQLSPRNSCRTALSAASKSTQSVRAATISSRKSWNSRNIVKTEVSRGKQNADRFCTHERYCLFKQKRENGTGTQRNNKYIHIFTARCMQQRALWKKKEGPLCILVMYSLGSPIFGVETQ